MKLTSSHGKYEKKKKMRLPLSAYLTYLLVATLLFTGVSFSKFATTSSGEDSARVAVMAMDTSYVIAEELPIAPGETVDFTVTLTNKEDNRICEVTQNYSMYVENLTNNMSLAFEYFLVEGASETKQDSVAGTFYAGVEESVTYKIKITWTGAPRPASSAFEVDGLKIVVKTEQVD